MTMTKADKERRPLAEIEVELHQLIGVMGLDTDALKRIQSSAAEKGGREAMALGFMVMNAPMLEAAGLTLRVSKMQRRNARGHRVDVACPGCHRPMSMFQEMRGGEPVGEPRSLAFHCEGCDGEINSVRVDRRFCSNACRQRAYRARSRANRAIPLPGPRRVAA